MTNAFDFELHAHLKARMFQRGVSQEEIKKTLASGWPAKDAKEGTFGKTLIFPFGKEWEGKYFRQKEVTVYYKMREERAIVLTVKARYGNQFKEGE